MEKQNTCFKELHSYKNKTVKLCCQYTDFTEAAIGSGFLKSSVLVFHVLNMKRIIFKSFLFWPTIQVSNILQTVHIPRF